MATERVILCGPVSETGLPIQDRRPVQLRMWGPRANVLLRIEDVRRAMFGDVPCHFLDLIDLAVYVYSADQAVPRGDLTDKNFGAGRRRRLFFRVPVRNPDFWNSRDVRD